MSCRHPAGIRLYLLLNVIFLKISICGYHIQLFFVNDNVLFLESVAGACYLIRKFDVFVFGKVRIQLF